jgi:hypothetical protein
VFGQWGRHLACLDFPTGRLEACATTHHDLDPGPALTSKKLYNKAQGRTSRILGQLDMIVQLIIYIIDI